MSGLSNRFLLADTPTLLGHRDAATRTKDRQLIYRALTGGDHGEEQLAAQEPGGQPYGRVLSPISWVRDAEVKTLQQVPGAEF